MPELKKQNCNEGQAVFNAVFAPGNLWLTNQAIDVYFGLTYSPASRRVSKTWDRLKQEKELKELKDMFTVLKSQIKVTP